MTLNKGHLPISRSHVKKVKTLLWVQTQLRLILGLSKVTYDQTVCHDLETSNLSKSYLSKPLVFCSKETLSVMVKHKISQSA